VTAWIEPHHDRRSGPRQPRPDGHVRGRLPGAGAAPPLPEPCRPAARWPRRRLPDEGRGPRPSAGERFQPLVAPAVAVVRSRVGSGLDPKGLEGGTRRMVERPVLARVPVHLGSSWAVRRRRGAVRRSADRGRDRPPARAPPGSWPAGGRCRPRARRPALRHATGPNTGDLGRPAPPALRCGSAPARAPQADVGCLGRTATRQPAVRP
jgi:hypothetical protein